MLLWITESLHHIINYYLIPQEGFIVVVVYIIFELYTSIFPDEYRVNETSKKEGGF